MASDLVAGELGDALQTLQNVLVGGDVVAHLAVVELLIGHQIEVAGAGETKEDGLFLAGLLALEGRAPLAGGGLRGDAFQPLLLGVVGLGNGGVQLVGAVGKVNIKWLT